MTLDIAWKFNFNPQVRQQLDQAIHDGVEEVFELDIKPEAVKGSPVRTGTNRRSIDTEVTETPQGTEATLFSQSGYGGYLELGTRKMSAQPYLFPAFTKFKDKIGLIIKQKIGALRS